MQKIISILLLFLCQVAYSQPTSDKKYNETPCCCADFDLPFKVKSLCVVEESLSPLSKNQQQTFVYFDERGKVSSITELTDDEKLVYTYIYNEQGQLSQLRTRASKNDQTCWLKNCTYTYNSEGRLAKELIEYDYLSPYNPSQKSSVLYSYSKNKLIAKRILNDDMLTIAILYQHNDQGKLTSERYCTPEGIQTQHIDYEYNEKGLIAKKKCYDSTQSLSYDECYTYSSDGKLLVEENNDYYRKIKELKNHKYNPSGLLVETAVSCEQPKQNASLVSHKYTYDDKGCWQAKQTFVNGKLEQRVNRDIALASNQDNLTGDL